MANGTVEYGTLDTTYGSLVPIVCNTGFELSGGTGTECLASGKWSTAVTCKIIGTFCPLVLFLLHMFPFILMCNLYII